MWIAEKREISGERERQAWQWQAWPKFGEEVTTAMNVKRLFKVTQPNQGSYHGIRTQLCIQEDTDCYADFYINQIFQWILKRVCDFKTFRIC